MQWRKMLCGRVCYILYCILFFKILGNGKYESQILRDREFRFLIYCDLLFIPDRNDFSK